MSVLFARLGSAVEEVTRATSVSGPGARPEASRTVTVTVVTDETATVPRLQETWPDPAVHEPTDGTAEIRVVPAGMVSVTPTESAGEGPALVTVNV
jgi:hypothetical protein